MSRTHNELSEVVVTVTPKDTSGNAYTPTTARYRVDDCLTGNERVAWTTIAVPSTSMQITIPGTANDIINSDRSTPEQTVLTVNMDKDLSTQHYEQYFYRIKDLLFAQVA
ncbi:MAG: hypothetical protein ACKVKT_03165 [Rhodospirillales bacterium]